MNYLKLMPLSILSAFLLVAGCSSSDNPAGVDLNDPSTLAGNYNMVSLTDKTGQIAGQPNQTFQAGQPVTVTIDVGGGQQVQATITLNGSLSLTQDRYTLSTNITVSAPGVPEQNQTETDTGTYSISGSTITIDSDAPDEGPESASISASGNRITIEDSESSFVFQKQ